MARSPLHTWSAIKPVAYFLNLVFFFSRLVVFIPRNIPSLPDQAWQQLWGWVCQLHRHEALCVSRSNNNLKSSLDQSIYTSVSGVRDWRYIIVSLANGGFVASISSLYFGLLSPRSPNLGHKPYMANFVTWFVRILNCSCMWFIRTWQIDLRMWRLDLNFGIDAVNHEHDGRRGLGAGNSIIGIEDSAVLGHVERTLSKIEHVVLKFLVI